MFKNNQFFIITNHYVIISLVIVLFLLTNCLTLQQIINDDKNDLWGTLKNIHHNNNTSNDHRSTTEYKNTLTDTDANVRSIFNKKQLTISKQTTKQNYDNVEYTTTKNTNNYEDQLTNEMLTSSSAFLLPPVENINNNNNNNNDQQYEEYNDDNEFILITTDKNVDPAQDTNNYKTPYDLDHTDDDDDGSGDFDIITDNRNINNITNNFANIFGSDILSSLINNTDNDYDEITTEALELPIATTEYFDNTAEGVTQNESTINSSSLITPTTTTTILPSTSTVVDDYSIDNKNKNYSNKRPLPGQISLVMVFDGTGSMVDDLNQLRSGAKMIIDKFLNNRTDNPIYNYIFVPFRDPSPALVTTNHQELLDTLNDIKLFGGGDCPESSLGGISLALKYALPKSFVYVFTDAIAKDFQMDGEIMRFIQKKQVTINFLLTGFCKSKDAPGYEVYEQLASASNGQIFNLQKTDIKDIIEDIKNSLDKRRVSLKYVDSHKPDSHSIDINIDENLKEFSVSVAGHKPNITIIDPDKQKYDKAKEVINLENLKIVNVADPRPGEWNIKAESQSAHSVRLTGLSDVIFNFGFSLDVPMNISQTSFSPLMGFDNILAISPTNNEFLYNLTSVDITIFDIGGDKNNIEKFTLPLTETTFNRGMNLSNDELDNKNQNITLLYVTELFKPPKQLFKIEVNGFDKKGNPLTRLLSTVIQSIEESAPEVSVDIRKLEAIEKQNFTIKCNVESLIPIEIQWIMDNQILVDVNVNQSNSLVYTVENADISHSGEYICRAINKKGFTEDSTIVIVHAQPLTVAIPQKEYKIIEFSENFEIPCIVQSTRKYSIKWYFNNKLINPDLITVNGRNDDDDVDDQFGNWISRDTTLIIRNVTRTNNGVYFCLVKTRNDEKSDSTQLIVQYPAKILQGDLTTTNNNNHNVYVKYNDLLNLTCLADGQPKPQILWYFQSPPSISNNHSSSKTLLEFRENIRIDTFQKQFEGEYICEANNYLGNYPPDRKTFNVFGIANASPNITKLINQTTIVVNKGDDIKIICKCELCKPITLSKWTFNAMEIISDNIKIHNNIVIPSVVVNISTSITTTNQYEEFLEIKNITEKQFGKYKCELSNDYGTDELIIQLEVLIPPKIENISLLNATQSSAVANNKLSSSGIEMNNFPIHNNNNNTIIDDDSIIEGSSAYIKCNVKGYPIPIIKWTKNGIPIIYDNRIYSTNKTLTVSDAKTDDAGVYECIAINPLGQITKNFTLLIIVPPKLVSKNELIQSSIEGENVILPCEVFAIPPPQITWLFNGHILNNNNEGINNNQFEQDQKHIIDLNNNSLTFKANATDSGIYECRAINNGGNISQELVLLVYVEPKIYHNNNEIIKIQSNNDAILKCDASGFPLPTITWTYNGYALRNSTNVTVTTDGNVYLKNVSAMNNDGAYVCDASNIIGITQKIFYIVINDPPKIVSDFPKQLTLFNEQEYVTLCDAIGNPFPKVYWMKNDKKYLNEYDHSGMILEINTKNGSDSSGNYTCYAENSIGIDTKTLEIIIIDLPTLNLTKIQQNENNKLIVAGDLKFEIHCPFYNFKDIKWLKASKMLEPETTNRIIQTNSSLQFPVLQSDDLGNYTCIVENEAGQRNYSYYLNILSAPEILLLPNDVVVDNKSKFRNTTGSNNSDDENIELMIQAGNEFTFECIVSGNPKPKIEWLKNNELIPMADRLLHIENVKIQDQGIYTCKASNSQGITKQNYNLNIISPPVYQNEQDEQFFELSEGENVKLNCTMLGNPEPIINWKKNDQQLDYQQQSNTPILELNNIQLEDAGTYKCIANNSIGSAAVTYHLFVFDKPKIIDITKNLTQLQTTSLHLNCKTIGRPRPILSWFYNGQLILTTSFVHYDEHLNGFDKLLIDENGNGFFNWDTIELNKFVLSIKSKDDHSVRDPSIKKLKYGILTMEKLNETMNFEIVLNGLNGKNSGRFHCIATNALGKDEKFTNVEILELPSFKRKNSKSIEQIEILEGLPLILSCPAVGYPKPVIYWYKNNIEIESKRYIKQINSGEQLIILQVDKDDTGTYICLAKNIAGENLLHFNVTVMVPPKIIHNSKSPFNLYNDGSQISIQKGGNVYLECPITGYPSPNITWLQINYKNNYQEIRLPYNERILNITSINDTSTYSCFANNSYGEATSVFHVNVQKRPYFNEVENDENLMIKMTHGFTLNCNVKGEPEPTVAWFKDGENILNNRKLNINHPTHQFFSDNNRFLRISSSNIDDAGRYICQASNSLGQIQKIFNVQVYADVHWSPWSDWSGCSKSCGQGIRTRSRDCLLSNGRYSSDLDIPCIGSNGQTQICQMLPCSINGGWSEWSEWSQCSLPCIPDDQQQPYSSKSIKYRKRECNSPAPDYGGKPCLGNTYEEKQCDSVPYCPLDGKWSNWTNWSSCSVTCGVGTRLRFRKCSNPAPRHGGRNCAGDTFESGVCRGGETECLLIQHGGWSSWSDWSVCSTSCNKGIKQRKRECNNPIALNGGRPCDGPNSEIEMCNLKICDNKNSDETIIRNYRPHMSFPEGSFMDRNSHNNRDRDEMSNNNPNNDIDDDDDDDDRDEDQDYDDDDQFNGNNDANYDDDDVDDNEMNESKYMYSKRRPTEHIYPPGSLMARKPSSKIHFIPSYKRRFNSKNKNYMNYNKNKNKNNNKNKNYNENEKNKPQKVIIKVINEFPISKDITQMSFNLDNGSGPFTVTRSQCENGYTFDLQVKKCIDIDECSNGMNKCKHPMEFCVNTNGGYKCNCTKGYAAPLNNEQQGQCLDVNECSQGLHNCTHGCENLSGSYKCNCPKGFKLSNDNQSCRVDEYDVDDDHHHDDDKWNKMNRPQQDSSNDNIIITTSDNLLPVDDVVDDELPNILSKNIDTEFIKYAAMICSDGYYVDDKKCYDIDECLTTEDDCGVDQTCLNTKGSYLCVPTPCPDDYERDELSGQCVQICTNQLNNQCTDNATIAQTISYTVLSIKELDFIVPILKLVNYDVKRKPLEYTKFIFHQNKYAEFQLEEFTNKSGIIYLYAKENVKLEKVYKLQIIANSYETGDFNNLMYFTKFVIYVYIT